MKMSGEQDEVLSLDDTDKSFSGFSSLDSEDEVPVKPKSKAKNVGKLKSVVVKPSSVKSVAKKGRPRDKSVGASDVVKAKKQPQSSKKDEASVLDISKLSESDLSRLREALGIRPQTVEVANEEESDYVFSSLENLPSVRVEVASKDISDGEIEDNVTSNIGVDMSRALFDDTVSDENVEEDLWNLPKLKAPQKGDAIGQSLANMINMACTSQCEVDNLMSKYKVPKNCDKACPPLVNGEIWKVMDKRAQTQDRGIVDIQNMVATGITPIVKLADVLKKEISSNLEARSLLSDALVVLGQVQYFLSVRRRYMIRPTLRKKYQGLCNISMPITTQLFGDDVTKDIKSCDSMYSIGREQRFFGARGGRGNPRFARRQFVAPTNYGGSAGQRYHPYPQRGQGRFPVRNMGYRIPRKSATATCTAPNPNPNDH